MSTSPKPARRHQHHPGVHARTVHDTALHLDITAGFHPAAPFSLPRRNRPYLEAVDRPPRRLRIGVNRTLGIADPEPSIVDALDTAVDTLRHLGHHIIDDHTPHPGAETFPEVIALRQQVLAHNRFMNVTEELTTHRDHLEPWFAALLDRGRSVTTTDLARYWRYRGQLDHWAAELFERYDLLLTPTTPTTAWPADGPDIRAAAQRRTIPIAYTAAFNDIGNPAISIPIEISPEGLPCAIQLVAPHHHDDRLLATAATIERAIGHLQPDLAAGTD
ncbi:amidase family protein [Saccharopolyspora sp. NPDC050642]|uniref:amidase family protein n=1 Tax=Saccharopolyspora sp. NPDC050642 TaxID=3157099 RepID=UPI0033F3660B